MLNQITDEELRSLYWDKGLSGKAIANLLGCSPALVSMRMKASGIRTRHASSYPPTNTQIEAWKANGKKLSSYPKAKIAASENGKKNKGRRKRNDYEFGGHEKKRPDGYIKVYVPEHPNCTADGYVMKHILVVERSIGRYLTDGECVHHINHIRDDNRIENLKLMTISEHMSMHMKERYANRRANLC
jgi:hypothetical protein